MSKDMVQFVKDRDNAFRSLDKDTIIEYCKKYDIKIPSDDAVLFGAIHKARLEIITFTKQEKLDSIEWLEANGFTEDAIGIPLEQKR